MQTALFNDKMQTLGQRPDEEPPSRSAAIQQSDTVCTHSLSRWVAKLSTNAAGECRAAWRSNQVTDMREPLVAR
ncbi:hypothetical protein CKAH01_05591 [Colletotrichum kahawae]|uniref:Uncharacterized protein n=1 Tax=Colletotrichum kahawae TaxID=34407 RepID=A0AAE0D682_COLKA|nr:hypothetical protein CKAH01_05591 [Colletotrichum kahawae]